MDPNWHLNPWWSQQFRAEIMHLCQGLGLDRSWRAGCSFPHEHTGLTHMLVFVLLNCLSEKPQVPLQVHWIERLSGEGNSWTEKYRPVLFLFFFLLMWTIFKIFIEFVTIVFLFYVLVFWPQGTWELNSPTRDQTCTPCIGWLSLNHWATSMSPQACISTDSGGFMAKIFCYLVLNL